MIEQDTKGFYQVLFSCPGCSESVERDQEKRGCESCMAWHHESCYLGKDGQGFCGACHSKARIEKAVGKEAEFKLCIATPCRDAAVETPANRHLAGYCVYHAQLEGRRQGVILKASGGLLLASSLFFIPDFSKAFLTWLPYIGLLLCLGLGLTLVLRGRRWVSMIKNKWPGIPTKAKPAPTNQDAASA
ncbi:MAG: hypothetical protein P1V97_21450 [Planctomycetota bacterium]|nr:hypothetical protein [Planctomycetota bacterium]